MAEELDCRRKVILSKLRAGEELTSDDLNTIWRLVQIGEHRAINFLKVSGVVLVVLLSGILSAKKMLGIYDEGVNAFIFLVCFLVGAVVFLLRVNRYCLPKNWLRCHSCGIEIAGMKVRELADSGVCPFCSKPWPLKPAGHKA